MFSRDLDLLANLLLAWLSPLWSSNSNVANDLVYRFRPVKPVPPQDSQIFRIHILLNFEILFQNVCKVEKNTPYIRSGVIIRDETDLNIPKPSV